MLYVLSFLTIVVAAFFSLRISNSRENKLVAVGDDPAIGRFRFCRHRCGRAGAGMAPATLLAAESPANLRHDSLGRALLCQEDAKPAAGPGVLRKSGSGTSKTANLGTGASAVTI